MSPRKPPSGGPDSRPPTLKDVAARADVSVTAVSLVLNQAEAADAIPESTQRRIFEAAAELSYRPNRLARSLRQRRSGTIGLLVSDFGSYSAGVMRGAEDRLVENDYAFFVASHRSRPKLLSHYLELFDDHQVEGYLVIGVQLEMPPTRPTVLVSGRPEPPLTTHVVIDHDEAVRHALTHLDELGHREIAFIRGDPANVDAADRWRAIETAAEALDIEVDETRVVRMNEHRNGLPSREDGYREGYALARRLLAGPPFTALMAFNDLSAIGAMRALLDSGRRVPEDVSVIGFDDIDSAAFHNPSLTTIRQPLHEMGELAANRLLSRLRNGSQEVEVVPVPTEMVVRDSTGPAPRGRRS